MYRRNEGCGGMDGGKEAGGLLIVDQGEIEADRNMCVHIISGRGTE